LTVTLMSETLAIIEKSAHRLAFYDLQTGQFEGDICFPEFPHEIALDPDGATAYVGHYGACNSADPRPGGSEVFVVDLSVRRLIHVIDCRPFRRLHGLQCDRFGRLFVLAEADDVLCVVENPKVDDRPGRAVRTGGVKGHLVAMTRDGQAAYCSNLSSHSVTKVAPFSATTAPVVIEPGVKPEGLCLSAEEDILYVLNRGDDTIAEIDTGTCKVLRTARTRGEGTRIYRYGFGCLLLASYGDGSVSILDQGTLREVAYLRLGGRATAASIHPDRAEAYVSLENDQLVRIDLARCTEIGRFPTGREPDRSVIIRRGC
jgi:DNA-binding beta-propeller fold protein YncE